MGYVFGCRVVVDDTDVMMAVLQPTGSPVVRRVAQRGGPNGRSFIPGTWDGSRVTTQWEGPPVVRLHPTGRPYAVIRTWLRDDERFAGWYVNLEQPWVRTSVGFDSRDDVLDVIVSDDLRDWRLKDDDELDFAVEVGTLTSDDARAIRRAAELAIDDVVERRWPFDEEAWRELAVGSCLNPTALPIDWDTP